MAIMLDAAAIAPPLPSPFAPGANPLGDEIDAREYPVGDDWLVLNVPQLVRVTEYWPGPDPDGKGAAKLRRIKFPVGYYKCSRELCSWPTHQKCGPPPIFLHDALMRHGVEVVAASGGDVEPRKPRARFCEFCASPIGARHDERCPRYAAESVEGLTKPRRARSRSRKMKTPEVEASPEDHL